MEIIHFRVHGFSLFGFFLGLVRFFLIDKQATLFFVLGFDFGMAFIATYGFALSSFRMLQFLFEENRFFFFFLISPIGRLVFDLSSHWFPREVS